MSAVNKAVEWALGIARDDSHGYSQSVRWGPSYDCSSFVISAFEQAGISVRNKGAETTASMKQAFIACGFEDITDSIDLSSGEGLIKGDVLLNENGKGASSRSNGHAALVRSKGGAIVHASNPTNGILTRSYYNYPWDCVLRYGGANSDKVTYFTDTNEIIPIHPTIFALSDMPIDEELAVYVNAHNITAAIGPLSIASSLDELAVSVSVNIAKSDARFTHLYEPKKGDILRIYTPGEIFRGVIVNDNTGSETSNTYTAVNIGWYLNKTKDTYQFNEIDAYDAALKLFADLGIPIVYISEKLKGFSITGVYSDKAVSEVLKDILSQVGGKWNYDIVPHGARVYPIGTFISEPKFRTSKNTEWRSSVKYRGKENRTSSIENMRNAVKVVSDTEVLKRTVNSESYQSFGFLQEIVKIDPEKEDANIVADTKLNELCREDVTRGFPMIVDMSDNTHAGDIIDIEGEQYIVNSANHEIKKGRHTLTVEVEKC